MECLSVRVPSPSSFFSVFDLASWLPAPFPATQTCERKYLSPILSKTNSVLVAGSSSRVRAASVSKTIVLRPWRCEAQGPRSVVVNSLYLVLTCGQRVLPTTNAKGTLASILLSLSICALATIPPPTVKRQSAKKSLLRFLIIKFLLC